MNNDASKEPRDRFWVWLIWFLVLTAVMTTVPSHQSVITTPLMGAWVEAEKAKSPRHLLFLPIHIVEEYLAVHADVSAVG